MLRWHKKYNNKIIPTINLADTLYNETPTVYVCQFRTTEQRIDIVLPLVNSYNHYS